MQFIRLRSGDFGFLCVNRTSTVFYMQFSRTRLCLEGVFCGLWAVENTSWLVVRRYESVTAEASYWYIKDRPSLNCTHIVVAGP